MSETNRSWPWLGIEVFGTQQEAEAFFERSAVGLDPATAILEVAAHKTFRVLDTVPHVLTSLVLADPADVHVVHPEDVPNPNWLRPGIPSSGQQTFGNALLAEHLFVALPSAVSSYSWNLIFDPLRARGHYELRNQERFALDTRFASLGWTLDCSLGGAELSAFLANQRLPLRLIKNMIRM